MPDKGDITFNYTPDRQKKIGEKWLFRCKCQLCASEPGRPEDFDMIFQKYTGTCSTLYYYYTRQKFDFKFVS